MMRRTSRRDATLGSPRQRPRMFIGCSSEGLDIGRAIQSALYYDAEPVLWSEGVFGLSGGTLETLLRCAADYDFAVFALTADDLIEKRGTIGNAPRDNVLLELGLFMGRLGRERTFFVICQDDHVHIPSDLAGVTPALFLPPSEPRFLQSALANATTPIVAAVRTLGARGAARSPAEGLADELDRLRRQVSEMRIMLADLAASAARAEPTLLSPDRTTEPGGLEFLRGVWVGEPTGSTAWCSVVAGDAVFAYCYGGSGAPTGIYYDWSRTGSAIVGRFRWFDEPDIHGLAWFEIQDGHRLVGGWWMHTRVGPGQDRKLPHVEGMVPLTWIRKSDKIPTSMEKKLRRIRTAQLQHAAGGAARRR